MFHTPLVVFTELFASLFYSISTFSPGLTMSTVQSVCSSTSFLKISGACAMGGQVL